MHSQGRDGGREGKLAGVLSEGEDGGRLLTVRPHGASAWWVRGQQVERSQCSEFVLATCILQKALGAQLGLS